jgi:hypothetical protein
MTGHQNHSVNYFFYFYFGDETQPQLLRSGDAAMACEK